MNNLSGQMKKALLSIFVFTVFLGTKTVAQTPQGCNIAAIRAAFQTAGHYTELNVSGQPCSLYFIDENPNDAGTAEGLASQLGAHLAVMNDATENANVVAAINAAGYLAGNRKVWLGYKRSGTAATTFYSLDGSTGAFTPGPATPVIFQNWASGEPNNSGYSGCCNTGFPTFCDYKDCNGEQCVQIYSNGLWNDEDCSDDESKSVIEVNLCPVLSSTQDTLICSGGAVRLWATTLLGSTPYTYSWTPGNLSGANHRLYPNSPTTYTVTVTDRYGCFQTASTDVTINTNCYAPPQPQGCNVTAIRNAFAAAGHYTELDVQGQDCSMYFIDESPNDAATAENLANALGAHLVVMNDASENANVVAAVNAAGYLSGGQKVWIGIKRTGTNANTFYALDGSTGNFLTPTTGGATPGIYQNWNGGEPNNSGYNGCCNTGFPFFCDYKDCYGEQCVQIYASGFWNDEDCSDNGSKSIIEVNLCPNIRASNDTVLCNPNTVTITTNVILGSAPYTYAWTPGGQTSSSVTVTPNSTTTYKVRVTDKYSCYQEDSTVTTVIPINPPVITASSQSVCVGELDTINYSGTYNTTATTHWDLDGASFLGNPSEYPFVLSWSQAGTRNLSLYITDDICTSPTTVLPITVNPFPISSAGIDVTLCSDSSAALGAASTTGYSYVWNPATGLNSSTVSNPVLALSNPTDTAAVYDYIVTTTSAQGCISSDTMQATILPNPVTTFTLNPATACIGENVTITYTGTNGLSAVYTWDFDGGNVVSGSGQGPYIVNWGASGSPQISLNVTESGCPGIPTVQTLTVAVPPVVDAGADVVVCSGGTVQIGSATVTGYTYQWSPADKLDNPTSSQPNFSYQNTSSLAETYTYTVVANQNGCTASDDITVTVDAPALTTVTTDSSTTFCEGNSVTLTSDDPNLISRSWFPNGETSESITVATGNQFGLTGYDGQGCYYVSNTIITTQVFSPAVALAPNGLKDESCTDYDDGSITLSPTGGNPPYYYSWDNGQTTNTISGLADGTYTVTVSDQYNCSATAQYVINTAVDFYVQIDSVIDATCFGFSDGTVLASSLGGQPPYFYSWSNGYKGARNTNLLAGIYTVTASDANGCAADTSITVSSYEEIEATTFSDMSISYMEQIQINITVTPFSGYTYLWSPASSLTCADCEDPVAFPVRTTTYTLVVRDENTYCLDTTLFKVVVDPSKRLYIPNAFTPNSDSRNDTWRVFAKGVKYFNIQVFNRWGEIVFASSDIESGWDGTYKGAFVSPGVYVYQLRLTYLDEEMVNEKGTVTIIR